MNQQPTADGSRIEAPRFACMRTDMNGIIRYANEDFLQLYMYPAEELVGAPASILRHPDMPAGVFWKMWQTLQAGKASGGYLCNRAQDGSTVWMFALMIPVPKGITAVQMRPLGPELAVTQSIYETMREAEASGVSPEKSAALMDRELADKGFADPRTFLSKAVSEEVAARRTLRLVQEMSWIGGLQTLRDAMRELVNEHYRLVATFRALYLVPTNMRILASRLEPTGGPISSISDNYKRASAEINSALKEMGGDDHGASRLASAIDEAILCLGCAVLQQQTCDQLRRPTQGAAASDSNIALFEAAQSASRRCGREGLDNVTQLVRKISADGHALQRLMAGLDQIRILGQVESGRSRDRDNGLASIMDQLGTFHESIHAHLNAMIDLTSRMRASATRFAA